MKGEKIYFSDRFLSLAWDMSTESKDSPLTLNLLKIANAEYRPSVKVFRDRTEVKKGNMPVYPVVRSVTSEESLCKSEKVSTCRS